MPFVVCLCVFIYIKKSRFEELIRDDEYSHRQPLQKSISALSFSSISPSSTSKPINMAPATARATSTSIPKANAIRQGLLTRPVAVATTAAPQASSSDNEDEDNGDYVGTITSTESGATERKKGKASESKKKKGKSGKKDARRHKKKKKAKTGKSSKAKHRRGSGTSSSDGNSNGNSSDDDDNNSDSSSSSSASDSDSDSSNSGGESGNVSGDCDFPNDKSSNGDENDAGNNNNSNNNNNGSIVEGTVGSGSGLLPGELESPDLRAAELQGWGEEEEEEEGAYTSPEIGADVPVFLGSLKQPYVLSLPELIENDPGMCDGRYVPENVHLCTTETLPGGWALGSDSKLVVLARRTHWRSHFSMRSMELGRTLDDVVSSAVFNSCRDSTPCCISALKVRVDMVESRDAQVVLTAVCTPLVDPEASSKYSTGGCDPQAFQLDDAFPASSTASTRSGSQQQHHHHSHSHAIGHNQQQQQQQQQPQGVIITALTSLPHKVITRYLGFVNMHIVRESFTLRNELGKEGFTTDIFVDMFAILRARVSAMNGNALIGFNMNIFHFKSSTQKDQGYCLVSLTGDAVKYRDA